MATIVEIARAISPVINDALMIEQQLDARLFNLLRRRFSESEFFYRTHGWKGRYYCDSAKIAVIRDRTIIHADVLAGEWFASTIGGGRRNVGRMSRLFVKRYDKSTWLNRTMFLPKCI